LWLLSPICLTHFIVLCLKYDLEHCLTIRVNVILWYWLVKVHVVSFCRHDSLL
jgi:hypothetical protein